MTREQKLECYVSKIGELYADVIVIASNVAEDKKTEIAVASRGNFYAQNGMMHELLAVRETNTRKETLDAHDQRKDSAGDSDQGTIEAK